MKITSSSHIIKLYFFVTKKMRWKSITCHAKQWEWEVCRIEKEHAENTHINIDSTIDGGENTCSGENSLPTLTRPCG